MTPIEAHNEARRQGYLPQWIITDHPSDYPDKFVARLAVIGHAKSSWTKITILGDTLKQVRDQLPPGLIRLPRSKFDDPVIVEMWT